MSQNSAPQADTAPAAPTSTDTAGQNTSTPTSTKLPPKTADVHSPALAASADKAATPNESDTPTGEGTFSIPEQYQPKETKDGKKQNVWVEKVKSVDDLWKLAANSQELIGRRHPTPDFANATPQEIEQYYAQVRPESKDVYKFETSEDYQPSGLEGEFADLLHSNGISEYQGNKMIEGFQAILAKQAEDMFDANKFLEQMETVFGNGYEMKTAQTKAVIEANLNDKQKAKLQGVPNDYLQLFYEMAANMEKNYGVSDTGKGGEHRAGATPPVNIEQQKKDLRQKIRELSSNPYHTGEDKQRLVDELTLLYSKK